MATRDAPGRRRPRPRRGRRPGRLLGRRRRVAAAWRARPARRVADGRGTAAGHRPRPARPGPRRPPPPRSAHGARSCDSTRGDADDATPGTTPARSADDRLRLIFTCCHPALTLDARLALTLKTVGGLDVAQVARAFLTTEPTMYQRLVRAKRKIVAAGIPYRVPPDDQLPERLAGVLHVVYLDLQRGPHDDRRRPSSSAPRRATRRSASPACSRR